MGIGDQRTFRAALLQHLERLFGLGPCSIHGTRDGGCTYQIVSHGLDPQLFEQRVSGWMAEFSPKEIVAASEHRLRADLEIVTSPHRRDRLSWYREFVRPSGATVFLPWIWRNRHGVFGLTLGRTGPAQRFKLAELAQLEQLLPSIVLADAYQCSVAEPHVVTQEEAFRSWADSVSLTGRERSVAALAGRGFRNHEIGALLRSSPTTVRNQLASIFRKADVTTRSELAFASLAPHACGGSATGRPRRQLRDPGWFAFIAERSEPARRNVGAGGLQAGLAGARKE